MRTLLVFLFLTVSVEAAQVPAIITVTTTAPGVAPDGACSLVEALENAASAGLVHADCAPGASATTIELAPLAVYTLAAVHLGYDDGVGLPAVINALTINGHGATIERSTAAGTPSFRLLLVTPTGALGIDELTLRNGLANLDGTGLGGGAILNFGAVTVTDSTLTQNRSGTDGGAISNVRGTLNLQNTTVTGNQTLNAGGGIRNAGGSATLTECDISDNQSTGTGNTARGGGLANHAAGAGASMTVAGGTIARNSTNGIGGAGIDNAAANNVTAQLQVTGARISENRANGAEHFVGLGGGIQNSFFRGTQTGTATVRVERSAITGNSGTNGGGISSGFDLGGTYQLSLAVHATEVSGNVAAGTGFQIGNGGGIYLLNSGAEISNSTVSGNKALGSGSPISGLGGGLMNGALNGLLGELQIITSTIASNQAASTGGGVFAAPFNGTATTEIASTVVAGNSAPIGEGCATLSTVITSFGYNLDAGTTCGFTHPTDLTNTNPMLGALSANGGVGRTHALLPGSPAINSGNNAICAAPPNSNLDQRGVSRPQGPVCDRGAYEANWPATALTLNTTFQWSDGPGGTGRFVLFVNSRFVDQAGASGSWVLPAPASLALIYDVGVACRGLWLGRFTSATQIGGSFFCLDGSGRRGTWSGVVVP